MDWVRDSRLAALSRSATAALVAPSGIADMLARGGSLLPKMKRNAVLAVDSTLEAFHPHMA